MLLTTTTLQNKPIATTKSYRSRLIAVLWPIGRNEWKKFFSMAGLMFVILLNQNLIRGLKDSLIVTIIGPEVLSYIKLFVELPLGILFVLGYTLLCNRMSTEVVFRIIILFFLLFFTAFGFWLFPYQKTTHPSLDLIENYIQLYPYLKWFFKLWGQWSLVLFYAMGELWPMIVFTLLYWQLANKITTTAEAGRFYFYFNLFGQANLLISGSIIIYFSSNDHFLLPIAALLSIARNKTELQVATLMMVVIALCIIILLIHRYIEKYTVYNSRQSRTTTPPMRLQLGLLKSLKMITKSKYLGLICLLMAAYSMTINLIEGLWFYEVASFYDNDSIHFMAYQGKVLRWTGVITLICSIIGNIIVQNLGWFGAALVTPVMTLLVGGCFFLLVIIYRFYGLSDVIGGIPIMAIIVAMGGVHNILAKGTKYCLFDATKEMAYIPLDDEMQTKGKAAIDILGGKLGKSCGSIFQVICYTFLPYRPDQLSPFLMVIHSCICIIWIMATKLLSKKYYKLIAKGQ